MPKKVLNREQIRREVQHRLLLSLPALASTAAVVAVPLPRPHSLDVHARNWDMDELRHPECAAYVRKVVDEARKDFFLSDARERDEILGDAFAHG
jgi:hypothetical protein